MAVQRILLVLATLVLSPTVGAATHSNAAAWAPEGPTACSFSSWTTNEKPAIQVRADASAQAKVVGTLPTTRQESLDPDIDYYSVSFDVTEARDGWLKIRNASDDMSTDGERSRARPVYRGEGWIEAGDAQVGIQSARGYSRPDAGSERLLDLQDAWLTERGAVRGIVACSGEWLLLDYEMLHSDKQEQLAPDKRTRGRAWFRGVCSASETTCDMPSVDED